MRYCSKRYGWKGKDINEESGVNRSVEFSNGERAIELEAAFLMKQKIINRPMAPITVSTSG